MRSTLTPHEFADPERAPPESAPYSLRRNSFSIILVISLIYTFYVAGLFQYYLNSQTAYQLNYVFPPILCAVSLVTFWRSDTRWPLSSLPIAALFVQVIVVGLVYSGSFQELIIGYRIYFPMFLVFLAVSFAADKRIIWRIVERGLILFPFVQLPFVLHQHFFIAPYRGIGWDAVVGTFPGSQAAGGDNGGLALISCCSIFTAYYLYQCKRIRSYLLLPILIANFSIVLLGEVKVVILIIPLMFFFQRGRNIWARPGGTAMIAGIMAVAGFALVEVYASLYWSQQDRDVDQSYDATLEYVLDSDFYRPETGEISRVGSIVLWAKANPDISAGKIFGQGLGSTRGPRGKGISSDTVGPIGRAAKKVPDVNLDATAISQLLWDLGELGLLLFVAMLVMYMFRAYRLARRSPEKVEDYRFRTIAGFLASAVLMLFYSNALVNLALEQMFLSICLGLLTNVKITSRAKA
jgi:hypothetical protein